MRFSFEQIHQILTEEVSHETKLNMSDIRADANFVELGLDSLSCIYVLHQVETRLGLQVNPSVFWDYPTIHTLSEHLFKFQHECG